MSKKTLTVITLILFIIVFFLATIVAFPQVCFSQAPTQQLLGTAKEYFDKASLQYLMGQLDEALANLKAALRIDPKHAGAQKLMKVILRERELPEEKEKAKAEKVRLIKEKLEAGKGQFEKGEFLQALALLGEVLRLAPDHKEASLYLAHSLAGAKEEERIKARYYWGALVSLTIGYLALALLLSFSIIALQRVIWAKITRPKKLGYCFNCKAKISPNIDLCPNCGAWIGAKMRVSISRMQKIWYDKVKWHKNPFTLDIHPELFTGYRREVKQILEKIEARSGHILVTGPLGVGKTTLLRWLGNYLADESQAVYISRPPQEFSQIIKLIVENMGFSPKNMAEFDIYHLNQLRMKLGKVLIILMDEAHEFTIDIERPLRTLGDLDDVKLVMAGLPETVDKFKNEIKPLYERLVLEITLEKLEFEDIKELIKARIENAGGEGTHPFTPSALEKIYELSRGNPRLAVKICDWTVTEAINLGQDRIDIEILERLKLRE